MRKPFVRLFATILTVCMLLSMLPAVAFAAGDAVALKEWNVTLEDVISVNFSVSIPAGDVAQTQAQITVEDETVTLPALEATVNNGNYVFPVELSASQLSSDIVLSVITAGEQVFTTTKSVREYSGILLNGTYNQAVEQMIKQLLNYGAAAQAYFDYNADNLANAGYETANTQPMITSAPFEMTASGSVPGVVFAGTSLLLQSRVAVRFYFDIAGDAQAYSFTIGGKDCQAVRSGDRYYVDATGINPQNYGDLVTVSVADSQGNQLEVGYSPLNYMVRMYPKADAKLQNLLYAMYCYHLEAVEYKSYVLNAEEPELEELSVEKNVADLVVDRILTEDVSFSSPYGIQVLVPAGVLLTEGAQKLTLKLTQKQESDCNVAVGETELLQAFDIRVEGVSMNNTVPLFVEMIGVLPAGLNKGNLTVFHVENGSSVKMEEVMDIADITAHNQFVYEPLDGALTLSMASFSEFALLSDTVNPWDGKTVDTTWYDPNAEEYVIANADQFAGFAQLSASETETESNTGYKLSFRGKTVKLANDINMGGESYITNENVDKLQFYPIGYNKDGHQSYFAGTFDGDGHTITNIYQNTWMMLGKYEATTAEPYKYYNAGMGLFGAIWNATIENLTVDHFRCENELGQAGVVALNADGVCTFKNIAITNCKPYTYNNNCAGILARDGGDAGNTFYFENITVDHSNTIGALWGTWDGVCAGIMAGLKEGTKVHLKNCHVAAEIDAYNDVCGNYQYYWYRYSGMLIARIYPTVQDENGYVIPDVSGITAENCTVNYGDWCNYYYCELVANSIASYTHDHQFSRLTRVKAVDGTTITYLDGTTGTVPASGRANYVVVNGEHSTENATCYHFVDGAVWNHADAGEETVNGQTILKEDRQHYHLPFGQLFTGSGWGIKNVSHYDGVEGITVNGGYSQQKFSVNVNSTLENPRVFGNANEITLDYLFKGKEGAQINASGVHVNVVPADETSTVSGIYTPAAAGENWATGKLKFEGTGLAYVTIQDYKFCTPTKLLICVDDSVNPLLDTDDLLYSASYDNGVNQNEVTNDSKSAWKISPAQIPDHGWVYPGFTLDKDYDVSSHVLKLDAKVVGASSARLSLAIMNEKWVNIGGYDLTPNEWNSVEIPLFNNSASYTSMHALNFGIFVGGYESASDVAIYIDNVVLEEVVVRRGASFAPGYHTVFDLDSYTHVSFDYLIESGETICLTVMDSWALFYGHYTLNADGEAEDYAGVTTTKLDDGYVHIELSLADLTIINGNNPGSNPPKAVNMLYMHNWGDASGYIDNIVCEIREVEEPTEGPTEEPTDPPKQETVEDDLINMIQDPVDVAFMGGSEAVRNTEIVYGADSGWSVNVKTAASFNNAAHSLNMATGKLSAYFYSPDAVPTNTAEIVAAWKRSNAVPFTFTDVGDGWYLGEVYMEDFVYEEEGVTTADALRVRIMGDAIIDCMSFDPDANIGAAE